MRREVLHHVRLPGRPGHDLGPIPHILHHTPSCRHTVGRDHGEVDGDVDSRSARPRHSHGQHSSLFALQCESMLIGGLVSGIREASRRARWVSRNIFTITSITPANEHESDWNGADLPSAVSVTLI